MIISLDKPTEKWFDSPNYGEIERQYRMQRFSGRYPEEFLSVIYSLSPNEGLIIPARFEIVPQELDIQGRRIEIQNARAFKKFAWYVNASTNSDDPQDSIREALSTVRYESSCLGYSWQTTEKRKVVPFISCIEGLEFLAICTGGVAEELYRRTGIRFNKKEPKIYADKLIWYSPSRHDLHKTHLTTLSTLPMPKSTNAWRDLDFEHTCEDASFKFKLLAESEIRYFCDHLIAAFRIAQLIVASDNQITANPFLIPREGLFEIDDILRYRVVRERPDGQKNTLTEAERGRIIGWLVTYYRRNLDSAFQRSYDGINLEHVIKFA